MLEQTIYGIVSGVGYAIIGWQSKTKFVEKKMDFWKLGKSVVICGLVGAFAGYSGQNFNVLITGGLGIGATKVVSVVWKLIKKLLKK